MRLYYEERKSETVCLYDQSPDKFTSSVHLEPEKHYCQSQGDENLADSDLDENINIHKMFPVLITFSI